MTFYEFLAKKKITDTPRGDFIGDVRRDPRFPKETTTWGNVDRHMSYWKACPEAYRQAKKLWAQYEKARANG